MNLDLGEGEAVRTEDLPGRARRRRWASLRARWSGRAYLALLAVATVAAILAVNTGNAWWTLLSLPALVAGVTLAAFRPWDRAVAPRRALRTDRPRRSRASGLTLRADRSLLTRAFLTGWARGSWIALTGRSRRSSGSSRPRRARRADKLGLRILSARRQQQVGDHDGGQRQQHEGDR